MKPIVFGLTIAGLILVLTADPVVGVAIGVAVFWAVLTIGDLERRVAMLEGRSPAIRSTADEVAPIPYGPPPPPKLAPAAAPTPTPPPALTARAAEGGVTAPTAPVRISFGELEALFAGRLLAVIGGIALFLGGVFFLGLAFSRGWIGPEARVAIGLVAGVGLFAVGAWVLNSRRELVGHVLVAVGLGVFTLAMFAATRLFDFFAPELGVGAALVAAAAAAALAIRFDSRALAAFGLVAVLGSPPVMGASASLLTIVFVGIALAGTTAIAVLRSWRWLPPIALILTVPQLSSYLLGDPPVVVALVLLGAYWLLNAISAAGEELHRRTYVLSPSSATVLLVTAAFTMAGGFVVLDGGLESWRGLYLLAVGGAHLVLAATFLLDESDRHPFGMLAAGSGIAAITMAVPLQLGAEWVPLAWAAEAVALGWIAIERRHVYSAAVGTLLAGLAAGHILVAEYPHGPFARPIADAIPFVNESGLALGFVLLAAGVAIAIYELRPVQVAVAAVAVVLVAAAVPHELTGWEEVAALTALVVGSLVVQRRVAGIPLRLGSTAPSDVRPYADRALYGGAAFAGLYLAIAWFETLPLFDFAMGLSSTAIPSATPFLDEATLVVMVVATGAITAGLLCRGLWLPSGVLAAAAAVAYLLPVQVGGAVAVAGWTLIAIGLLLATPLRGGRLDPALRAGAIGLAIAAALQTVTTAAPIERFWVQSSLPEGNETAIANGAVLAVVSLVALFGARALLQPRNQERRWAAYAAMAAVVWAVSISVVDVFQAQVGGRISTEELAKQAQVGLSVLWAIIGAAVTIIGLRLDRSTARLGGLALLGIVTVKVFVADLAALDIAYRVLSFVALGVLLLVAAYLYMRMQPRAAGRLDEARHRVT